MSHEYFVSTGTQLVVQNAENVAIAEKLLSGAKHGVSSFYQLRSAQNDIPDFMTFARGRVRGKG